MTHKTQITDFGYADVAPAEKTWRVGEVFSKVSPYYDVMNDVMSFGMHRLWKRAMITIAQPRRGMRILDLAAGSGDLTTLILARCGDIGDGGITVSDINPAMLAVAKRRLNTPPGVGFVVANAERLPFDSGTFHQVYIAFGLRNITDRPAALREIYRVLRPSGRAFILEFSKPDGPLAAAHRCYLERGLPLLGKIIADDTASYRYLAESIIRFIGPRELADSARAAGFRKVRWYNFCGRTLALHCCDKI